ncbi:MAG: hypothetical protein IPL61_05105 [Myxococcales bacterium]|nr:hypothetical protein [Myxococcales bacterium]
MRVLASLLAVPLLAAPVGAEPAPAVEPARVAGFTLHGGGYLQPQLRVRQDDPVAPFDEDGFRVRRARVIAGATRELDRVKVEVAAEAELTPDFRLLDASVAASSCLINGGGWRLEAGQFKVPVSRQALLSDSRLGFVDKPELASLAPDRQLGAMATVIVPNAPMARVSAGLWNGEGVNQGGNVDQHFLYAGRFELRVLGRDVALAESALGGRFAWLGASAARQRQDAGDGLEDQTTLGADVAVAVAGASGTFEYLQVEHAFVNASRPDYRANGVVVQAAYLLPRWGLPGRIELAARWEEIDRNDAVPIVRRGDPDQSLRSYTAGATWYLDGHDLKVQATASSIQEVEDQDALGRDARYANDTLLVQVTARID